MPRACSANYWPTKKRTGISHGLHFSVIDYVNNKTVKPLTLNASQLRERLGISRSSLYRYVKTGVFIPLPNGPRRNRLFPFEQVEVFLSGKKK